MQAQYHYGVLVLNKDFSFEVEERDQLFQIHLLKSIVSRLGTERSVSHVLVRGSFANELADRSSDIDLVVGVREASYEQFNSKVDVLMSTEFGALFPGWLDTMVGDMGGSGFVYLVPVKDTLCQLDMYITSEPYIQSIVDNGAKVLLNNKQNLSEKKHDNTLLTDTTLGKIRSNNSSARSYIVEVLVIFYMLRKRVLRGQTFIVYGLTYMLTDAIREFIKQVFTARPKHWGWYFLEDELGTEENLRSRNCLRILEALITAEPIQNRNHLQWVFDGLMEIIFNAAPDQAEMFGPQFDAYRAYLKLS